MVKLKVKNFGPITKGLIKNDGWLEIKKNTFLIGEQGSGKSTVAKLFSLFSSIEKSINRKDYNKDINFAKFKSLAAKYKLEHYFKDDTVLAYQGNRFNISLNKAEQGCPIIKEINEFNYFPPKIIYIPTERIIFSVLNDVFDTKRLPDLLYDFGIELKVAQRELKGKRIDLKLGEFKYKYNENQDVSYVFGEDFEINMLEASSGLQSYTPLYLVSKNIANSILKSIDSNNRNNLSITHKERMNNEIAEIMLNDSLSDAEKKTEVENIRSRFFEACFINIVEEPELNLFPDSQWQMLKTLVEINNQKQDNKLLAATHSPYLLNFLPLFVKAYQINKKIKSPSLKSKLNEIVPDNSYIKPTDLAVYELKNGEISSVGSYRGLPSDENSLNDNLGIINDLFVELLEIEDKCK